MQLLDTLHGERFQVRVCLADVGVVVGVVCVVDVVVVVVGLCFRVLGLGFRVAASSASSHASTHTRVRAGRWNCGFERE